MTKQDVINIVREELQKSQTGLFGKLPVDSSGRLSAERMPSTIDYPLTLTRDFTFSQADGSSGNGRIKGLPESSANGEAVRHEQLSGLGSTYIAKTSYDAYSILMATTDDTPVALTVGQQTLVGRVTGGAIAAISIGIADDNITQIDQADVATNDYAKFTANGLSGRSYAEVKTDLGLVIGTNVQAWSAVLDTVTAGTYTGDDSITTIGTLGVDVLVSKVTPMFKGTHTTDGAYYSLYRSGAANSASTILDAQTYLPGPVGNAVTTSVSNTLQKTSPNNMPTGNGALTVAFIAYPTSDNAKYQGCVAWGTASSTRDMEIGVDMYSTNKWFVSQNGQIVLSVSAAALNEWSFVIVRKTASSSNYKIDVKRIGVAKEQNTGTMTTNILVSTLRVGRGATIGAYNSEFIGKIDEVRISNYEWSDAEVLAYINGDVGSYGTAISGLVAGYHFDETSGTNADDFSTSSLNDLTWVGTQTWSTGLVPTPGALALSNIISLVDGVVAGERGTVNVGATENDGYTRIYGARTAFYGGTPVALGAALTTQLTTITHTAPGTPDYALQNLVQNTGFGFATADEGNSLLKVIANLQTRCAELEARLGSATGVKLFT